MATFKAVVFKHQKREDETYRVSIRITNNRKSKYIPTDIFVSKSDIKSNFEIKDNYVLKKCLKIIDKYQSLLPLNTTNFTTDELVDVIHNSLKSEHDRAKREKDSAFYDYSEKFISRMEEDKRAGSAANYRLSINTLKKYNETDLSFSDINFSFLSGFEEFMKKRGIGDRGRELYLGSIRTIINKAILELNDEENDIIIIKSNPFNRFKIKKSLPPEKRSISIESILRIINLPDSTERREQLAKDVFLLSFFLIGMNAADLFTCETYNKGRIDYFRQKTTSRRADKAEYSVLVPPEAAEIIKRYADPNKKRVFRFYLDYATTNNLNAALNKGLKKIGEKIGEPGLEFYAARHSWATIAANDLRINKYTIHEALNHVDQATRITDTYIKKDWAHIDDANRNLLFMLKVVSPLYAIIWILEFD